jgi:iron only hydrogenase large subunit-like protein
MDKSQLVDVIKHIMNGRKVVAMYAPSIAAQFKVAPGQLEGALKELGFAKIWEVAIGADITSTNEAREFEERMEAGHKMMTTSCCPAYVRAVRRHVPELESCISETHTPMHYTAELARKEDPDAVTVFIGPCLAKRREGMDDEFVDYVLSVEEIGAFLIAKDVDVSQVAAEPGAIVPSATGRGFAASGGVAEAVRVRLKHPEKLRATVINGLTGSGMKQLAHFGKINAGTLPYTEQSPNLIEVMACEGGCIAGPSVITNPKVAAAQLKKYVAAGLETPAT